MIRRKMERIAMCTRFGILARDRDAAAAERDTKRRKVEGLLREESSMVEIAGSHRPYGLTVTCNNREGIKCGVVVGSRDPMRSRSVIKERRRRKVFITCRRRNHNIRK